jgi:hypothetical protein
MSYQQIFLRWRWGSLYENVVVARMQVGDNIVFLYCPATIHFTPDTPFATLDKVTHVWYKVVDVQNDMVYFDKKGLLLNVVQSELLPLKTKCSYVGTYLQFDPPSQDMSLPTHRTPTLDDPTQLARRSSSTTVLRQPIRPIHSSANASSTAGHSGSSAIGGTNVHLGQILHQSIDMNVPSSSDRIVPTGLNTASDGHFSGTQAPLPRGNNVR